MSNANTLTRVRVSDCLLYLSERDLPLGLDRCDLHLELILQLVYLLVQLAVEPVFPLLYL